MTGDPDRFKAVIESSADAVCLVDAQGQVLYANPSTARVLGYEPDDFVGRNALDLFHPLDRDRCIRMLRSAPGEPPGHSRTKARVRREEGQWRWVESTASNLLDEPRVGAIALVCREMDNGDVRQNEVGRAGEEFERCSAALQIFAGTVAPRIKEPLWVILILAELVMRQAQLNEADQNAAYCIIDRVRDLAASLDDLMAAAVRDTCNSLLAAGPVPNQEQVSVSA